MQCPNASLYPCYGYEYPRDFFFSILHVSSMAKAKQPPKHASKAHSKRTVNFKKSGQLKKTIENRKKHQQLDKKIKIRQQLASSKRKGKGKANAEDDDEGPFEDVDALLQAGVDEEDEEVASGSGVCLDC